MKSEQYWGLPTLAHMIRWLEEVVAILSKPFLMVGFIVSMLDLLTQGRLLNVPLVVYGWALIQAVAVDATFFVVWYKVKKAAIARQWLQFIGFVILGLALGIVAWAAMDIQSLEQALGIANAEALARLNLNPVMLTHLRSLVAVIMGGVVAMIAPEENSKVITSQARSLNTSWWVPIRQWSLFKRRQIEHPKQEVNTDQPDHPEQSAPVPDSQIVEQVEIPATGEQYGEWPVEVEVITSELAEPFSFTEYAAARKVEVTPARVKPSVKSETVKPDISTHPTKGRQLHVVEDVAPEQRVRMAYAEHGPDIANRELARIANVSPATAGKWKEVIKQEGEQKVAVAAR